MKICFTASGSGMDSLIDPRFGRCQYLLFVDPKKSKLIKSVSNSNVSAIRGAGIATAQNVLSEKADIVITGNVGPNAFSALQASGVKVYTGIYNMKMKDALKEYKEGHLKEASSATVLGHFGGGGRFGGSGRGRGLGKR
jgi:predicted Fe-Mo cluster-binding NifX family protein